MRKLQDKQLELLEHTNVIEVLQWEGSTIALIQLECALNQFQKGLRKNDHGPLRLPINHCKALRSIEAMVIWETYFSESGEKLPRFKKVSSPENNYWHSSRRYQFFDFTEDHSTFLSLCRYDGVWDDSFDDLRCRERFMLFGSATLAEQQTWNLAIDMDSLF